MLLNVRDRLFYLSRAIFLFLFGILSLIISTSPALANLQIYHLEGEAKTRTSSQSEWQDIQPGEEIQRESEIKIEDNSYLEIKANNNHSFRVNEKTGLKFNLEDDADSINLYYGTLEIDLDPRQMVDFDSNLTVHTPVSTMGVRGTKFKTAYELEQTNWTGVDSGAIWFEANTQVELGSGHGVDVEKDTNAGKASITRIGKIRKELRLTWDHWAERKKIKKLEQKFNNINNKISKLQTQLNDDPKPRQQRKIEQNLGQLKLRKKQLEKNLTTTEETFENLKQRYNNFRKNLEKRRKDFIENRQKEFTEFTEEREQRFEKYKERREKKLKD